MATSAYICDGGCGFTARTPDKLTERGAVRKGSYCAECLVRVDAFLTSRDELHDRLAELWEKGLRERVEDFAFHNGQLPDG